MDKVAVIQFWPVLNFHVTDRGLSSHPAPIQSTILQLGYSKDGAAPVVGWVDSGAGLAS